MSIPVNTELKVIVQRFTGRDGTFHAGQTALKGRRTGHAAITDGSGDTAGTRMKTVAGCGIHLVRSPDDIGSTVARVLFK